MAITDKKVSEVYANRDISSLSDRPNQDGLTGTQLKARFDQLGKEIIPNYNDLIDELNDVVLPAKADQSTTYTKTESDSLLSAKVDKVSGKSLIADTAITDLTDSGDTTLHKHDTMYYTESETDTLLLGKSDTTHTHDDRYYTETETDNLLDDKVDKVVGSSLVADSVMTDLTDGNNSTAHYHSADRNTDNHTDGTTNKVFSATEKTKLEGIEAGAEVNNISDVNATDLTDGGETTLHIHDGRYYTETEIDTNIYTKTDADTLLGNKVDKITGKGLSTEDYTTTEKSKLAGIEALAEVNNISDINATDLTDLGNTDLHTHKLIQNEVSVDNAKVEALATGVKITRNVNDGNSIVIIDGVNTGGSSAGYLIDFRAGGVQRSFVSREGTYYTNAGVFNHASSSNSKFESLIAGAKISRNIADANPALIVNQANASSTGNILDLQFGGVSKASVDRFGVIKIGTKTPASASATGVAGEVCWDADFIYCCVSANTWKRVAIATW